MNIGENIKKYRKLKGMTLADLSEKVGVSRQTINRYESGVISNIPSDNIEKIAKALDIRPSVLMGWTSDNEEEFDIDPTVNTSLNENNTIAITISPEKDITKQIKAIKQMLDDFDQLNMLDTSMSDIEILEKCHEKVKDILPEYRIISPSDTIRIPVYEHLKYLASDEPVDFYDSSDKYSKPFALKISEDSMTPIMPIGCVVFAEETSYPGNSRFIIVRINDSDAVVRKYVKHPTGFSLVTFNTTYPTIIIENNVSEYKIEILGTVERWELSAAYYI